MKIHLRTNLDYLYLTSTALVTCKCPNCSPCKCGSRYEVVQPPRPYTHSHGFITYRTRPDVTIDDYPPYQEKPVPSLSEFCQFTIVPVTNKTVTIGRIMRIGPTGLPRVKIALTGDNKDFTMAYSVVDQKKPMHMVDSRDLLTNLITEFSLEPFRLSPSLQRTLRMADNGSISLIRDLDNTRVTRGPGELQNVYKIRSYHQPHLVVAFDNRERFLYVREEKKCFLGWQLFFITSIGHDDTHLDARTVADWDTEFCVC